MVCPFPSKVPRNTGMGVKEPFSSKSAVSTTVRPSDQASETQCSARRTSSWVLAIKTVSPSAARAGSSI